MYNLPGPAKEGGYAGRGVNESRHHAAVPTESEVAIPQFRGKTMNLGTRPDRPATTLGEKGQKEALADTCSVCRLDGQDERKGIMWTEETNGRTPRVPPGGREKERKREKNHVT